MRDSATRTVAAAAAAAAAVMTLAVWLYYSREHNEQQQKDEARDETSSAYEQLIGNTPLVELRKLSALLKCRILVKMESQNPGGTGKDRAAMFMLNRARRNSRDARDIVEGTSGSTGIALAALCRVHGLQLHVVMPDDQSEEKRRLLASLGAKVRVVPACAISNRDHYVNTARRLAEEIGGVFVDQFENLANFEAHYKTTGPEIWNQTAGLVDAFCMSAGTGGTLAGVSQFLKEKKGNLVRIVLADPQGSSLLRKVTHGVCFTPEQSERRIRKHRYDSIAEGVGLDRITANFDRAKIDTAVTIGDQELVLMAHWLLENEGLFVGSSSALNIAAACQVARDLGPGHTIVTVVCEGGVRGASRFWNKEYLASRGLVWPVSGSVPAILLGVAASGGWGEEEGDGGKEEENQQQQEQITDPHEVDDAHEVDDGLDDFAEYAVTVDPPAPPPPPTSFSSTPKKPALIRPAGPKTPATSVAAAAAAAAAAATPLPPAATSSSSSFEEEEEEEVKNPATPNTEAQRVAAMKAAMLAQKEKQRIKRGLAP